MRTRACFGVSFMPAPVLGGCQVRVFLDLTDLNIIMRILIGVKFLTLDYIIIGYGKVCPFGGGSIGGDVIWVFGLAPG